MPGARKTEERNSKSSAYSNYFMEILFPLAQADVLLPLLERLAPDTQPRWGSMNAQRMIEHLDGILQFSVSNKPAPVITPEEKLPHLLQWLRTDKPLSRGISSPAANEGPLLHPDLSTATNHLLASLQEFFRHYSENPSHQAIHVYFGPIGYEDWQRFHQKHFRHHFTQFGLLEE